MLPTLTASMAAVPESHTQTCCGVLVCKTCCSTPDPAEKPLGASAHLCVSLTQQRSLCEPGCQRCASGMHVTLPWRASEQHQCPVHPLRTWLHGSGLGCLQTHPPPREWRLLISARVEKKKRNVSEECRGTEGLSPSSSLPSHFCWKGLWPKCPSLSTTDNCQQLLALHLLGAVCVCVCVYRSKHFH